VLTADTITDEQIRELKLEIEVRFERGVNTQDDRDMHALCLEALGEIHLHGSTQHRAKRLVAARLNARAEGKS
jgi:hypothetical protein